VAVLSYLAALEDQVLTVVEQVALSHQMQQQELSTQAAVVAVAEQQLANQVQQLVVLELL
jgi:hypothetical protein